MYSLAAIAGMSLVLAVILRAAGKASRIRAGLFFVAGCGLGGVLGSFGFKIANTLTSTTGSVTAKVFGAGVPIVLVVGLVFWAYLELFAKGGKKTLSLTGGGGGTHPMLDWVMLLLPVLLLTAGGSWALFVQHAQTHIQSGGNGILGYVQQLASGL